MRLLLLFLPLFFIACEGKPPAGPVPGEAACRYNDRVIAFHDSLRHSRDEVGFAIAAKKLPDTRRAIDSLRAEIRRLTDSLRALPDFEGDSTLRVAAVALFTAYYNEAPANYAMLGAVYTKDVAADTLSFSDSLAEDTIDLQPAMEQAWNHLDRKWKATAAAEKEFSRVQQEFAERHHFRLAVKPVEVGEIR